MVYNMTAIENSNNLLEAVGEMNILSGGLFIGVSLLVFYITLFIILKYRFETTTALLATSFSISVVSIIFWGAGLIGSNILFYPIIMLIISVIINVTQG